MAVIDVVHVLVTNLTHADECSANPSHGMTGFGHNPESLLEAVGKSEAMANVMTASFAQAELTHALRRGCEQVAFLSVHHP
jgi:hypothetical protein